MPITYADRVTQFDVARFTRNGSPIRGVLAAVAGQPLQFHDDTGNALHAFAGGDAGSFVLRGDTADIMIVTGGVATIYECETFNALSSFAYPAAEGPSVAATCAPSALHAVTAADDRVVRIWDARTASIRRELPQPDDVTSLAVGTFDGASHLAVGRADGIAAIHALAGEAAPRLLDHEGSAVLSLAFGLIDSTTHLFSGTDDGRFRAWHDDAPHDFDRAPDAVTAIGFFLVDEISPVIETGRRNAGPVLATGCRNGDVLLWDGAESAPFARFSVGEPVTGLSGVFDGDARLLVGLAGAAPQLLSARLSRDDDGVSIGHVRARWTLGSTPAAVDSVHLSTTPDGVRALFRTGNVCEQWLPTPDLRIVHDPGNSPLPPLRCRLELAWPQPNPTPRSPIKLRAVLTPGFQLGLRVRSPLLTPLVGVDVAPAWPAHLHGTSFGFVLARTSVRTGSGRVLLALTAEPSDSGTTLGGFMLAEHSEKARINIPHAGPGPVAAFAGSRTRMTHLSFRIAERTNAFVRQWDLESAYLVHNDKPDVSLYWADQRLLTDAGTDAPRTALLSWTGDAANYQAVVRLRRQTGDSYAFDPLVHYRKLAEIDATATDQAGPVMVTDGIQVTALSGVLTNRVRTGSNADPLLIRMSWTASGPQVQTIPWDAIPVHPCLDADTFANIPVLSGKRPQLTHHVGFGLLVRQELPAEVPVIETATGTTADATLSNDQLFLLDPIVGNQILTHDVALRASSTGSSTARTENLLAVRADASDDPIIGLFNRSSLDAAGDLVDAATSDEQIRRSGQTGIILHRTLRNAGPSEFRFVDSPLAPETGSPLDPTATAGSSAALAAIDARLLPPRRMLRWNLSAGTYIRTPIEEHRPGRVLPERARRLRFRRQSRIHAGDPACKFPSVRGLFYEATAFDDMQPMWHLPSAPPDFQPSDSNDSFRPFAPHHLEITYAPDKPGAMIHHGFVSATAVFDPDDRTKDRYDREPLLETALRDPQQIAPPPGAAIELEPPPTPTADRDCLTWLLKWKEVLGRITLLKPDDALQIVQTSQSPPEIKFRAGAVPLRLVVQINEDLFEIDAAEQAIPFNQKRDGTLVAPRLFLVTRIPNLLDPLPFTVTLPDSTQTSVDLIPSLIDDDRLDGTKLTDLFVPLTDPPPPAGYFLYQLKPDAPWNPPADALARGLQYWLAWLGSVTYPDPDSDDPDHPTDISARLEAIVYDEPGKKGLKGIPFMLVPPKIVAVACADTVNGATHKEALQRTVLFGDAADPKTGRGLLLDAVPEGISFRYEVPDQESLTIPSPSRPRIDSWEFILIRHSALGSMVHARRSIDV
ncbi:MAG: hypothetical protein QM775_34180 [Pirellulales bacterium]